MNIGFYGHSAASWAGQHTDGTKSFITTIVEHYNANLVNTGVPQGSEERILFELKKTKKLDLAVIFHSIPRYLFLPGTRRDIDIKHINDKRFKYVWENDIDQIHLLEQFEHDGIQDVFGDEKTFVNTLTHHKKFLSHPDLIANRYSGALVQIDQYVSAMGIPAIHIVDRLYMPNWFKFRGKYAHGVAELVAISKETGTYPNNISKSGQLKLHTTLCRIIDQVLVDNV